MPGSLFRRGVPQLVLVRARTVPGKTCQAALLDADAGCRLAERRCAFRGSIQRVVEDTLQGKRTAAGALGLV
jgi:hypothetical protein